MAKYKAIMVFLLAMTIILSIYIFSQGISTFKASKESSEETWNPSIQCIGYIYSIQDISYNGSTLKLRFENKQYSDSEIRNITITSDKGKTASVQTHLIRGSYAALSIPVEIEKNFTIYPEDCSVYKKTCILQTQECKGYEPPDSNED